MKHAICTAVLLAFAVPAAAQETGQVGLVVGFPGSIGMIWHASDAVAVRPDFSFTRSTSEAASGIAEGTSTGVSFGVSALWYVAKVRDNVRTYVSPRFGYQRTSSDTTTGSLTSTTEANAYSYSGTFGVQYTPSRRFSVYGEVGLQYTDSDSTFKGSSSMYVNPSATTTSSSFGSRGGVGIVFYFN